ncbi:MAG: FAD-dependent oxidoreductase [Acidobacteriota bacterium]
MGERQNVILGGGLAGMSAAYTLRQAGQDDWQVYERESRVGGLARSMEVEGYKFDYGPHILFTIDDEMEALIRDLLGDNFHAQVREAYIYHQAHDLYTEFPFQAHLAGLPSEIVKDCLVGLVRAVEAQAKGEFSPQNYEDWMRGFFGEGIADHLMIPYAKKIWTVEPSTMDFNWIGRRVPTPNFERIIAGALSTEVAGVGATSHFWYPRYGGIEPLPKALGQRLDGMVQLNQKVERIELPQRQVVFAGGEVVPFDKLIFTFPLCHLQRFIPNLPPEVEKAVNGLAYQGIYCVNLGVKRPNISDKHWVYFYEDIFPFHRLSFPGTFSPDTVPEGCSSIATEVAFSEHRPLDEESAVERTIEALRAAKILHPDDEIDLVHTERILPAYVIYDLDHGKNVTTIRSWLETQGIWTAGRFGEWQYFNMDHSMRSGKKAAEAVMALQGVAS